MRLQTICIAATVLGWAGSALADAPDTQPAQFTAIIEMPTNATGGPTTQGSGQLILSSGAPTPAVVQMLEKHRGELLRKITELHKQLQAQTHRLEVTPAALHEAAADLDNQLQSLELEEVAANARRDAIEQEIAVARNDIRQNASNDISLAELQANVDRHSEELDNLARKYDLAKQTNGSQSSEVVSLAEQVDDATQKLSHEQAELADEKTRSIGSISPQEVSALSKELIEQTIDGREREAKIQFIRNRLDELSAAFDTLAELSVAEDANSYIQKYQGEVHIIPNFNDSK
jgi:chromosome segregation ATPase